ncbi:glycosyl-transferase for dystroglycan-domain-containing protein [Haematococcus lacustris]
MTATVCQALLLLLLSIFSLGIYSSDGADKAKAVVGCMPDSCLDRRTVWAHMLEDVPPCLAAKRAWWSSQPARHSVTLITQLSADRLPALRAQCAAWSGPLAAAVYLPLHNPGNSGALQLSSVNTDRMLAVMNSIDTLLQETDTAAAAATATATAARAAVGDLQRPGGCQLRVLLVYEVHAQEKATTLYPVNSLRNFARLLADTPLIANIDVDMLPSASLSATLLADVAGMAGDTAAGSTVPLNPGSAASIVAAQQQGSTVFVLPAFETACGGPALADQIARSGKAAVAEAMRQECLAPFRARVAVACHNATDFPRWLNMGQPGGEALEAYQVDYQTSFEPWFISSRSATAWFDVRYRGYGKNKIQQVAHMASQGVRFRVHPTGFLVHRPHTESQARKIFLRVKFKSRRNAALLEGSLFQHVEQMWLRHEQEIQQGTFQVVVDNDLVACLRQLPWWRNMTTYS